jgi:hypothetical protein
MHTVYTKSQIIHIHELSYINCHPQGYINTNEYKSNTSSLHNIKKNNGSYKYKKVNTIHNVTLTYSCIKVTDVPMFILHVVICTETSRTEVYDPKKDQVLQNSEFKIKIE